MGTADNLFFHGDLRTWQAPDTDVDTDAAPAFPRVRCPRCRWRPNPGSRWSCSHCPDPEQYLAGCGTSWNTFTTRGRCPGCGHPWRWTMCLWCGEWSLHADWYVRGDEE